MLEAHIDACTCDGYIEGWARFLQKKGPCIVRIDFDGAMIARGVADKFRYDLLSANVGHGHYAYRAKVFISLAPGDYIFNLKEETTGLQPSNGGQFNVRVPTIEQHGTKILTVEELLRSGTEWRDSEIYDHVDALGLDQACVNMGIERFIDVAHMYVLNRRANSQEISRFLNAYVSAKSGPREIFCAILLCEERQKINIPLPSPFSSEFPF